MGFWSTTAQSPSNRSQNVLLKISIGSMRIQMKTQPSLFYVNNSLILVRKYWLRWQIISFIPGTFLQIFMQVCRKIPPTCTQSAATSQHWQTHFTLPVDFTSCQQEDVCILRRHPLGATLGHFSSERWEDKKTFKKCFSNSLHLKKINIFFKVELHLSTILFLLPSELSTS